MVSRHFNRCRSREEVEQPLVNTAPVRCILIPFWCKALSYAPASFTEIKPQNFVLAERLKQLEGKILYRYTNFVQNKQRRILPKRRMKSAVSS
jgi:predicted P-loop ATPase/GTPase